MERPILFSTPMVQALLAVRKTQTRRIVKLPKHAEDKTAHHIEKDGAGDWIMWCGSNPISDVNYATETLKCYPNGGGVKCPYGKPGDVLWVRESFRKYWVTDPETGEPDFEHTILEFAADGGEMIPMLDGEGLAMYKSDGSEKFIPWKPSIHMPKEAARIWLELTGVKVERAKSISKEDAEAEGVLSLKDVPLFYDYMNDRYTLESSQASFCSLWIKINGVESWQSNPWVWCVSFKVLSTTGKPLTQVA